MLPRRFVSTDKKRVRVHEYQISVQLADAYLRGNDNKRFRYPDDVGMSRNIMK